MHPWSCVGATWKAKGQSGKGSAHASMKLCGATCKVKGQSNLNHGDKETLIFSKSCPQWLNSLFFFFQLLNKLLSIVVKGNMFHSEYYWSLFLFLIKESGSPESRVNAIHFLVHKLPEKNKEMLDILVKHLTKWVFLPHQFSLSAVGAAVVSSAELCTPAPGAWPENQAGHLARSVF